MPTLKFVFLYTEIANYFISCVAELSNMDVEIHVVRWPVNKEAPYDFRLPEKVRFYDKSALSRRELLNLVTEIEPDFLFVCGWVDKDYLSIAKKFRNKFPVVSGLDNQWQGTLKQRLASTVSKFTLHKYFSHIFAAGKPQAKFANKLGFHAEQVITGYYSADVPYFREYYSLNRKHKGKFPKRFIYVGRYVPEKGLQDLWDAFIQLQEENPNEWELWCIGTGPLANEVIEHPKIKHLGFIQPYELGKYISDTGVFVLPSHYEPWGVVVHEFAAAGYPLLCSTKVGAATEFLQNNINGYIFEAGNKTELKEALLNFVKCTNQELDMMGDISADMALRITPEIWSSRLLSIVKKK